MDPRDREDKYMAFAPKIIRLNFSFQLYSSGRYSEWRTCPLTGSYRQFTLIILLVCLPLYLLKGSLNTTSVTGIVAEQVARIWGLAYECSFTHT
jgi:hypothetical protein